MFRRAFVIFLVSLCCAPISFGGEDAKDAEGAVKHFYNVVLTIKHDGVPSAHDVARLSPFISRAFADRLTQAREAESLNFKNTRGGSPPLLEGVMFFSNYEGADRYTNISREPAETPVSFLVDLEFTDPNSTPQKLRWHDRAIVIEENHKWVVDDLELLGQWPFSNKGKLSDTLLNAIKKANEPEP